MYIILFYNTYVFDLGASFTFMTVNFTLSYNYHDGEGGSDGSEGKLNGTNNDYDLLLMKYIRTLKRAANNSDPKNIYL